MRVFGCRSLRTVKLGLAPCFVLSLIIGCESSGPGVTEPPKEGQVTVSKVAPLTPEEKRKTKSGARALRPVLSRPAPNKNFEVTAGSTEPRCFSVRQIVLAGSACRGPAM